MEEPLSQIAALAAELAEEHCRRDASPRGTCAWYHGTVDYLRLLGVMSSPAADRHFLVPAFERLLRDPALRRVLVSGAGDCSMLAQILSGFQAAKAAPDITLIDRCATPVRLNQWFARQQGLAIDTAAIDVMDFEADEPFGIISTHCFLGFFAKEERPALFDKWFSLLRPGGYVVTVTPIRNVASHDFVGFGPEQAASFEARALAAARENPNLFDGSLIDLKRRIEAFIGSFGSFPVRSVFEFTDLFEAAGFVVEECAPLCETAPGGGGPGEHGLVYQSAVARRP